MPLRERNLATAAVEEWFAPARRTVGSVPFRTLVPARFVATSVSHRLIPATA